MQHRPAACLAGVACRMHYNIALYDTAAQQIELIHAINYAAIANFLCRFMRFPILELKSVWRHSVIDEYDKDLQKLHWGQW